MATAGASAALLQHEWPSRNLIGADEDVLVVTPEDLAGATTSGVFANRSLDIEPTAVGSYALFAGVNALTSGNFVVPPDLLAAYVSRRLGVTGAASHALAPASVNVEPLALLRLARTTAATSEQLALDDARRRLDTAKGVQASRSPGVLVGELSEVYGLNQLSTSRAIGVTPTAVRKWRRGEPARTDHRERLALIVALLGLLREAGKEQPAAWLDVPISIDSTIAPIDLIGAGRWDLVLRLGLLGDDPRTVLDSFDPDWRTAFAPDLEYEVIVGPDGDRVVVPRGDRL
jgi:hypothetical protein